MNINGGRLSLFLQLNPALIILLGLLNGIVSFFYYSYEKVAYAPIISGMVFLLIFLFFKLFSLKSSFKQLSKFAIFTIAGWYLAYNAYAPSPNNYATIIQRNNCAAEINVLICDTNDPSSQLEWMPKPRVLMAEVMELRISQNSKWIKSSGQIVITVPEGMQNPEYGEVVLAKGAFLEPEKALFEGCFDYKQYLLAKGVRKVFNSNSIEKLNSGGFFSCSLMGYVLKFRNNILDLMTKGMEIENRRMMAAVMFGCRQGLDYENKKTFLQSGVIHIFAVSGLHVGMLALALFLLVRWAPFRFRYLAVPFLLLIYVLTTGMQASALRALLMISLWSFMKGFLYKTSSLNIVFLAASIILVMNPFSILTAGFQFSFTIAFFLVISWDSVKIWSGLFMEKQMWVPSDLLNYKTLLSIRLKRSLFNSFTTTLIAWLSGSALLFFHRSFFIPGAVFTNFIIIPFVWLLFLVTSLNLLLIPFHFLFSLNKIIDILLDLIRYISISGSEWGGGLNIVTPDIWVIILFFIVLLFFTLTKSRFTFLCCGVVMFCIITFTCFQRNLQNPKVVMFYGGESQEPGLISIPSGIHSGVAVLNPGSNKRTQAMLNYLKRNGVNSIDYLIFTENRKSCCEGAWLILSGVDVKHAFFTPEYKRSRYAKSAYNKALETGVYITVFPKENLESFKCQYSNALMSFIKNRNTGYKIEINQQEWKISIEQKSVIQGEKQISIVSHDLVETFPVINSSRLKFIHF